MSLSTIQTVFLLYSALSFLSAILIGALFWKRRDYSANLWIWGCLLTAIATAVTVYRNDIVLIISFSLMISFEALSILLFSESLKQLGDNTIKTKLNKLTLIIPAALFTLVEIEGSTSNGVVTPLISATATLIFGITNVFCVYQVIQVRKKFSNRFFFGFLAVAFGIMSCLYLFRIINVAIGYSGYTFDTKILNIIIWFMLALFGAIRNLAYIVLRLHLGLAERSYLNTLNLKLSQDLEERNNMILSLERLNRSASINALASTISHEINQPLGASRLNAQFAEMKLESDPNNVSLLKELVKNILEDINRASTIVKNLSRLSSNQNNSITNVNLAESINQVIEISKGKLRASKIIIELDCASYYQINVNMSEWQQVLINLINNAIDALDGINAHHKRIGVSAKQENKVIKIFIQDNGPGIKSGQESKIFDLMVSDKATGSGIGLWLSKNIIDRFGGKITAHNPVNGGACFVIELPIA
jgi:signal transduction histidine kinase/branched-subunit amino acid transport protein